MTTKAEILKDPYINQFLKDHPEASDEIKLAAEKLVDKSDAIPALKKLLPALLEKKVRVFFSYKKQDKKPAETIVNLLREPSEKLEVIYMADFTREIAGKNWRDHIRAEVSKANWFILLLPDPSVDWDWCLYETGLFEAQLTSVDRLICLHHPEIKLPDPIKDYHAVPADQKEVEKFLSLVFLNDNPVFGLRAIKPNVKDRISEISQKIIHAIVPPKKTLFRDIFEPWLELRISNAKMKKNKEELDGALVVSANKEALDLFNFQVQPKTFGELRSGLTEQTKGDNRWFSELFHVVRKIANGRKFNPIQAVFQTKTGKMYRPILCAVDRKDPDGPAEIFQLIFAEEVSYVDATAIPENVAELSTILRFAFRFRWEVLEKFGNKKLTKDDVIRVKNAIERIERDWESRGMATDDRLIEFFSPEQKKRVAKLLMDWKKERNDQGTGKLDIAIKNKDRLAISTILKKYVPLNQGFVEMAAERFSELASGKRK